MKAVHRVQEINGPHGSPAVHCPSRPLLDLLRLDDLFALLDAWLICPVLICPAASPIVALTEPPAFPSLQATWLLYAVLLAAIRLSSTQGLPAGAELVESPQGLDDVALRSRTAALRADRAAERWEPRSRSKKEVDPDRAVPRQNSHARAHTHLRTLGPSRNACALTRTYAHGLALTEHMITPPYRLTQRTTHTQTHTLPSHAPVMRMQSACRRVQACCARTLLPTSLLDPGHPRSALLPGRSTHVRFH